MGPHLASLGRNHEIIMKSQQNLRHIFFYFLVPLTTKMISKIVCYWVSLCGLKCDIKKIRAPSSESWEKPRDDVGCSARWRFCTKSYDCFTWFRGWINCQSVQCLLLAIIWITACGALHILSQTFINPIFIDKLKTCSSGDFGYVLT